MRDERKVLRDGYVAWDRARYGVHWSHAGRIVHVQASHSLVEIWSGDERLATCPRATRYGQRLTLPGQREGLPMGDNTATKAPYAFLAPDIQVEMRSLEVYGTAVVSKR